MSYYKNFTFEIKDLVATIMILNNKTEISKEELYNLYMSLYKKMEKEKIYGSVMYSNVYLKYFEREYSEQFYVGQNYISLKNGYNIDWLIENITPYISLDKLEFLELINLENTNETTTSV
ncbi:MAG: hypothetical protein IJ415_00425 [Clostridia bacterium]|nr:hypothetical protein [Clostridia bacterium]